MEPFATRPLETAINAASVGYSQSEDHEVGVLDRVDDAVLAHPDPPQIRIPDVRPTAARAIAPIGGALYDLVAIANKRGLPADYSMQDGVDGDRPAVLSRMLGRRAGDTGRGQHGESALLRGGGKP